MQLFEMVIVLMDMFAKVAGSIALLISAIHKARSMRAKKNTYAGKK